MRNGNSWVDISFSGLKNTYLINIANNCLFSNLHNIYYIIFIFLCLGEIYKLILKSIIAEKIITIKKFLTIKNSIIFYVVNIEIENESPIGVKAGQNFINNGEIDITIHNNRNKLNLKDNTLKN